MDPLSNFLDRLLRLEESVTIHIQDDVFPAVAPAHHMADGTGILDSRCPPPGEAPAEGSGQHGSISLSADIYNGAL